MSAMDAMDTPLASTTAVQVLAARADLDQQRQDLLATEEPRLKPMKPFSLQKPSTRPLARNFSSIGAIRNLSRT